MKLRIATPTKAFIEQIEPDELERLTKALTYTNTSASHQVKRHLNNRWWRQKNEDSWKDEYDRLRKLVKNTLVFEENGQKYIRPGSIPYLSDFRIDIVDERKYPAFKKVAWAKPLPFELYPYQKASVEKLIAIKHGNVEICTGGGKSAILLKICRETGLKSIIVAPSKGIFNELVEKFETHLGRGQIGKFGDGRKVLNKKFTICIGDSLCNIKPGTKEWEFFSTADAVLGDEAHTLPAETQEAVFHGVLKDIPYRMFFTGTLTRGDGAIPLLQSIAGQTVHSLTTQEAVKDGYVCPHDYRIIELESSNPNQNDSDVLQQKRIHFLRNRNICAFIAKLVNSQALSGNKQTLVLVEELNQIAMLLPLLKVTTSIAHSEKNPQRLTELGLTKVDPTESIEKFNKGESMCLIGTSCISVGVNIFANHSTCNWVGGASPIRTLQGAVGRSVRLHSHNPWKDKCVPKDKCTIYDFDVMDIDIMRRHLEDRISFYEKSGSEIRRIRLPR